MSPPIRVHSDRDPVRLERDPVHPQRDAFVKLLLLLYELQHLIVELLLLGYECLELCRQLEKLFTQYLGTDSCLPFRIFAQGPKKIGCVVDGNRGISHNGILSFGRTGSR